MIWRFFINPIMIFILRSPLHFLVSHSVLVLYVTGAITGKQYFIPVSFFERSKGLLTCVTDKPNIWWRNLIDLEKIKVLYKGNMIEAEINIESENNQIIADSLEALCAHSKIDGFFARVGYKNSKPIRQDVEKSAAKMVLIKLTI